MEELLRLVRKSCVAATWSRGVELARSGSVVGVADHGDEIELRVTMSGGVISPLVSLFPDELEWDCECNSRERACMHVAAAVIAVKQSRSGEGSETALPQAKAAKAPGAIAYRLFEHKRRLALRRVVQIEGEDDKPIRASLKQAAQGLGRPLVTTEADLQFERRFGTVSGGIVARDQMNDVLRVLRDVELLTLDGEKVELGPASAGLCIRIWEVGEDLRAQIEQDPAVGRIFENGALLRNGILMALGEHGLSEQHFRRLRAGWEFAPEDVGNLAGDLLPRWKRRRMPMVVQTDRLPETRTLAPRLHLATARTGDTLEVLATIVYGDPAVARVDGDKLTLLRKGETAPVRNLKLEQKVRTQLRQLDLEAGVRRHLGPGEAMAWRTRADRFEGVGWQGDAHQAFYDAGELAPQMTTTDGGVDLWFEAAEGDGARGGRREGKGGRVDAAAVVRAWEQGHQLVPLMDGGFGRVPGGWLSEHASRVMAILRAKEQREDDELPSWALPDVAALCQALEEPPPPAFEHLRALVEGFEGLPALELPAGVEATLRDYQSDGVRWLGFLRQAQLGGLLADDMGLGKTLQALCALEGKTLVVAPTSVLPNWAAEVRRFRPNLSVCTYHGPGRAFDPEADITLTTYALLRIDIDAIVGQDWDTVVLDEAQAIKNPDSQVARAAFRVPARFRIAMTGTPVENRLEDLWSQMHFANPGMLGGRSEFNDRYVKPIAAGRSARAAALRERIRPFILRRRKSEVLSELPPRTDVALYCELSPPERELYDAVRAATQDEVAKRLGAGESVMAMLEALLRLRQAACHPGLVPGGEEREEAQTSAKLTTLVTTLEEIVAEEHKALVFSQWTSLLDRCEPVLEAAGLDYVRLDGSTRDRGAVVEKFQSPDGPPVMLISLRAGGTGLNLTAADHVFLLDPWWNPAVEDQAADRAHRMGQERPVLVHRLVARDTVEERILALQESKRALAEAAIGDAAQAQAITRDELRALLE
ncbi:MAG: DEAD/DEAH box helicase [Myxococcota bacterium]